jgi:hypothetical protein
VIRGRLLGARLAGAGHEGETGQKNECCALHIDRIRPGGRLLGVSNLQVR